MISNLTVEDVGRKVLYVPRHAHGNSNHGDCEEGYITSFNDRNVFVRYGDDCNGKATSREDLIWVG